MTGNKAEERLNVQVRAMTDTLEAYAAGRLGWDGFQGTIRAAFAAERRNTVARIRERLVGARAYNASEARYYMDEDIELILDAEAS